MNPSSSVDSIPMGPKRRVHVWLPLLPVWVLLLPFILLLAPLIFVACLVAKIDPFQGVSVYWEVFSSLRGLRVEVNDLGAQIQIF